MSLKMGREECNFVAEALEACRELCPTVHCITNYVSMDLMANVTIAVGASPAMVHWTEEVEQMASVASAIVVNIGTLSEAWGRAMVAAALKAQELRKPWILDPVAVGLSPARKHICDDLLACRPTIVCGNASEIMALAGQDAGTCKGPDATATSDQALDAATSLAQRLECVVAVTGKEDYVTDGTQCWQVCNGVAMLQSVTATGCSLKAVVAAFASALADRPLEATVAALAVFGVASELSLERARGPGTFRAELLDNLHNLTREDILTHAKITRLE